MLIFLWFVTSVGIMVYGASNGPVATLGLPRWSSVAVLGIGFVMLLVMFAGMLYGAATDVPWFDGGNPRRNAD